MFKLDELKRLTGGGALGRKRQNNATVDGTIENVLYKFKDALALINTTEAFFPCFFSGS